MSEKFKLTDRSIVARHQRGDLKFRKTTKILNGVFGILYRIYFLPLFGIGKSMILLKTIGRKTGKKRFTPVLCKVYYTGELTLYSARGLRADWLKNILATENQQAEIQKGFKKIRVSIKIIESIDEREEHLKFWMENFSDAKFIFGYQKRKHGDVTKTEEFKNIAKMIEFIQLIPIY